MAEETPRRMRRFQRKQQSEEEGLFEKDSEARREGSRMEEDLFSQANRETLQKQERMQPGRPDRKQAMELAVRNVRDFKERHNRLPREDEYEQIADNIYSQLKEQQEAEKAARASFGRSERARGSGAQQGGHGTGTGKAEPRRGRTRAERTKESKGFAQQAQVSQQEKELKEIKGLGVKELLGEDFEEKDSLKSLESEESEETANEEDFSLEGMETSEGPVSEGKCPNCKKETEEPMFCPNCGSAFCENCAKAERIGSEKRIICPKCKKQIKK